MEFVAFDVETANANMRSICQIGIARFENGQVVEQWESFVNPEDFFSDTNVAVHGIDEKTVTEAPKLPDIYESLLKRLEGRIVVIHTHFDRVSLHQACAHHGLRPPECRWIDSAQVTRRCWTQFASSGYGLKNVCKFLGLSFSHHHALEDAKAAGHILLAAIEQTGLSIDDWLVRIDQPAQPTVSVRRQGDPTGPLFGEVMVFTGTLRLPRREAADLADRLGCEVGENVTKRTTLLVVGDQDVTKLAGRDRSAKHRKAEELIVEGHNIRILRESDFLELVALLAPKVNSDSPRQTHLFRSIDEPIRGDLSLDELWNGPDKGLIGCWERGRQRRMNQPELAHRASEGELLVLNWRGGVEKKIQGDRKYGSLQYLAEWQGLRGENLDLDMDGQHAVECTRTGQTVIFLANSYRMVGDDGREASENEEN